MYQDKQNRDPVRKYVCGAIVIMAMRMFPGNTGRPLFGTLRERIHKFVHSRYRIDAMSLERVENCDFI